MLELKPIEFFLRLIPEGFLYILGIYVFSKIKINKKKYVRASLITAIAIFIIRKLPINYGVHTILTILFIIFLSIFYNKVDSIQAIKGTIITFITQFLSEGINMLVLTLIPNINLDKLFNNPITKTLLGLPSLIITMVIVIMFYNIFKRKDEIRNE